MTETSGQNAAQITYWNESAGAAWVAGQAMLDAQLEQLGLTGIEALAPRAGETVIDIGCGCGATSLELARRVGPSGAVVGVDISEPMLGRARERADAAGLAQTTFVQADAQTHALPAADAAFSRFGVMFFEDPPAAFANVRKALGPTGRLVFVCWRAMAENPWITLPMAAAASLLPPPAPPPQPGAPGPFAFADGEHVRGILRAAGFGDIKIEPHNQKMGWPDVDTALQIALQAGPLGAILRDNPSLIEPAAARVREAFSALSGPDGVQIDSATWVVTAR